MIAVSQTTENVWSVSFNDDDLELIHTLSELQRLSRREIVIQVVALGMIAYANIAVDEMEENLYD